MKNKADPCGWNPHESGPALSGAKLHAAILGELIGGAPLAEVLNKIACWLEADCPGAICSILLLDESGQFLLPVAGPSLPEFYSEALTGVRIGPNVGSCGTAAYTCQQVIVTDIGTHSFWTDFRDLATKAGLRACWSIPIRNKMQQTLGTIATYYREPRGPEPRELEEVESCASLVGVAIEYHRVQAALRKSEANLRTLIDGFPFMVWFKDTNSRLLAANKAYARMAGVKTTEELEGKTDFDFFPAELARKYVEDDRRTMESSKPFTTVEPIKDGDGLYHWIEVYKCALHLDGNTVGSVGYARDVTAKLQQEQQVRSLIENSPIAHTRYNRDCRRIYANQRVADFYGVTLDLLLDILPSEFPGGTTGRELELAISQVFNTGVTLDIDLNWIDASGRERVLRARFAPEFDANNQVISVIGVGQDVTETLEKEAKIQHMAYFDALTDLPNRAMFLDRIGQAVALSDCSTYRFALMLLDLDHFKRVNDTLGHAIGDSLLAEAAKRLMACIRGDDLAARLGGDEFAVMLPAMAAGTSLTEAAARVINSFSQPFRIDGKELFVSASLGIALYPCDSSNIDELFKFADSAMYHAKAQGRNNCQFYSAALTEAVAERMRLEGDLRKALQRGEMYLYFQPKVNLCSGNVLGAEALLRWQHSERGLIMPDQFISIAEETGMIVGLGAWVIAAACRAVGQWNAEREQPIHVAVNLSTRQFLEPNLLSSIRRSLVEFDCKPHWLQIEITESLLLEDNEAIRNTLKGLRTMGIEILIDDFGIGFSSLSYLNKFPISQIKIDRAFVRDMTKQRRQASLVNAIIAMARSLDKETVAEGVENIEQAKALAGMGCNIGQGFLYGKPLSRAEFEARIGHDSQPEMEQSTLLAALQKA